jgi:hypothetical protein
MHRSMFFQGNLMPALSRVRSLSFPPSLSTSLSLSLSLRLPLSLSLSRSLAHSLARPQGASVANLVTAFVAGLFCFKHSAVAHSCIKEAMKVLVRLLSVVGLFCLCNRSLLPLNVVMWPMGTWDVMGRDMDVP